MKINKAQILIYKNKLIKFDKDKIIKVLKSKHTSIIFQSVLVVGFLIYATGSSVPHNNSLPVKENIPKSNGEIVTPTEEKKQNKTDFNEFVTYNSFETENYVEGLLRNWPRLLDLFTSNSNFRQTIKGIDAGGLEKVSGEIKKTRSFSPGNVQALVDEYGEMIKRECNFYKLDWRLVLAIIRQESYFNPDAVSHAGALGFMQIMPRTGQGLQNQLSLEDTRTPQNNLIAGIYYYASLASQFSEFGDERYKFALAAYNAGLGRVIDALTITAYLEKDYKTWDNVKESYPYLSSKSDSLHALIWPDRKKPTYGTLDNWKEPYNYVDAIWFYYTEYKKYYESNLPEEKKVTTKKSKKKKK
ncbi:MAG: transglycosylase SLT domain-containing protein [Ignavibacteria bacterium]|nr:transglycosylase SLT domain-containing protein [Ignavibacteria bacterium]